MTTILIQSENHCQTVAAQPRGATWVTSTATMIATTASRISRSAPLRRGQASARIQSSTSDDDDEEQPRRRRQQDAGEGQHEDAEEGHEARQALR